jgi:16S rRNA C967 or C1407 C5-methylase (RsmB/RsmF family)
MECKPNGTIVYSTCSLSPVQNEGVVNTVLDMFANDAHFTLVVQDLTRMKHFFEYFYSFSNHCQLGLVVAPHIQKNFGPFYLCKLKKIPK